MDFPHHKFDFKTVSTSNFFEKLYRILNYKIHYHHSHITGKIFGYAHDVCNRKVRGNKTELSFIGHNFLGFDIFYMIKGYKASCWGTNDFNMGGSNLTTVNFANIGAQVKIIDTIKYYQSSLAAIAATASENEKKMIKKLTAQFISRHSHFGPVWQNLNIVVKENILDIVAGGKGIIPYEKIVDMNSLEIVPARNFFERTEFYSALKQKAVSDCDYESSKYLFESLKMRNLSDMNSLYNVQDVILLTEIIENRFEEMFKKYHYNPRKCNWASTLSGCIQRDLSKVILTLPTCNDHVEVFEKTLTGVFSSVNTRMGFDTEILLPNLKTNDYNKMSIGESFKSFKNQNFKVGYKLKLDGEMQYRDLRVTSKIIKFDENNQYGFAMTKPMPTGSMKEKTPSWVEFNLLLESVNLDDKIGHLFDYEKPSDRVIMYNELFPPIIEKKKTLDANERSVFQLCELYCENDKGKPKSYKTSSKSHSTLLPKNFIPVYLEELKFFIPRCGWIVTKLYKHYYFEQSRFKRNFIIMNQKSR